LLLARGYARDPNLKWILGTIDELQYFILDPIFQKQNDAALSLTERL